MTTTNPVAANMARQYATGVARRYIPVLATFAGLALLIALVPSTVPDTTSTLGVGSPAGPSQNIGATPGTSEASDPETTGVPETSAQQANGEQAQPPSGTNQTTEDTSPNPSHPEPTQHGVARSGVQCVDGARQVTWSKYAPMCEPTWSGNNGGATSHGVTEDTITVTFRKSDAPETRALSTAQKETLAPDADFLADVEAYLPLFNKEYELYGRQVELKPYTGRGNWLQESTGQNQQGAQADAATARSMGSFADISHFVYQTMPYSTSLAQNGVIALNTISYTQSFYEQFSPFLYTTFPTADSLGHMFANVICARLSGQNASFAGDKKMRGKQRAFGITVPDGPNFREVGDIAVATADDDCGQSFLKRVDYAFDVSAATSQASSIISQMKSAGVTTVVVYANASYLSQLMQQANLQNYRPEWLITNAGDPGNRLPPESQMKSSIGPSDYYFVSGVEKGQSEAYRAFKRAQPDAEPRSYWYAIAYYSLVQLFDGIQAAGPNLSPVTFRDGLFSMPTSLPGGDDGTWTFGPGAYSPISSTQITAWDSRATSQFDGQPGASQACDDNRWYPIGNLKGWDPLRTQPACPGRPS